MLNLRQSRFVDEYMVDLNATQAAIRAGYSVKTADDLGRKQLQKPAVAAALAERQAERERRTQITADAVVLELAKVAFANMADYMRPGPDGDAVLDFSKLTREQAAALAEVTVEDFKEGRGEDARTVRRIKFKLHDKLSALEKLGRHLGLFVEKGPTVNVNVAVALGGMSDDELIAIAGGSGS